MAQQQKEGLRGEWMMMTQLVIQILNMSFAAGCTAILVMVLRRLLCRLPKGYSYALWLVVLFRFLCPVVLRSPVSLFPVNPEPVRQEIIYQAEPKIQTGVIWVDRAVNGSVMGSLAPETQVQSANPIQIVLALAGVVWVAGMAAFFLYHLAQYVMLKKRLSTAVRAAEYEAMAGQRDTGGFNQNKSGSSLKRPVSVRMSDQIDGAFVLGVVHPVIYLPSRMEEASIPMVLRHELVHIRRRDGLMKLLWLAAVMIHWFNPLAWLSFRLMCADMEMSCDEQALHNCSMEERKGYSRVLLAEAERRSRVLLPLAFGKNSAYQRIQNILNYRRPRAAVLVLGGILLAAAGISLMVSPQSEETSAAGGEERLKSSLNSSQNSSLDSSIGGEDGDAASVAIIGGADGPTSVFLAGKLGDDADGGGIRTRPDSQWLASIRLNWRQSRGLDRQELEGEKAEGKEQERNDPESADIFLDLATEESVMFHGDFGLFAFERDRDGYWRQSLFLTDAEAIHGITKALNEARTDDGRMQEDSIHWEDRFISSFDSAILWPGQENTGHFMLDYAAGKMADGRIAVLGANPSGSVDGRLIDLWYGYYDPEEQVMTQVYLFLGDGREVRNYKDDIEECRYLFSRNEYDYFLRTPRSFLSFEQDSFADRGSFHLPYGRLELVRSRNVPGEAASDMAGGLANDSAGSVTENLADGSDRHENAGEAEEEVLDNLVCMQNLEHQRIVLTEERIVYTAAAEASNFGFKNPGLVSIRLDGSDRRIAQIPYQVYRGLSYDDGYLYYEGWTNAGAFPRPLYRMKPDFTAQERIGGLTGSLMAVLDGGVCWQMDWDTMRIMVSSVKHPEELWPYLADGEVGRYARCDMRKMDDSTLQVVITPLEAADERKGDEMEKAEAVGTSGPEDDQELLMGLEAGGSTQTFYLMIPAEVQID